MVAYSHCTWKVPREWIMAEVCSFTMSHKGLTPILSNCHEASLITLPEELMAITRSGWCIIAAAEHFYMAPPIHSTLQALSLTHLRWEAVTCLALFGKTVPVLHVGRDWGLEHLDITIHQEHSCRSQLHHSAWEVWLWAHTEMWWIAFAARTEGSQMKVYVTDGWVCMLCVPLCVNPQRIWLATESWLLLAQAVVAHAFGSAGLQLKTVPSFPYYLKLSIVHIFLSLVITTLWLITL